MNNLKMNFKSRDASFVNIVGGAPKDNHYWSETLIKSAQFDAEIERLASFPDQTVHIYPDAGHGFNCDMREDFHAEAAKLALERNLVFLAEKVAA